jgi:hypothetical protein
MLNFIKKLLLFKLGQKSARGTAKILGFGKLGWVIGLVGGWRAMRRSHRHA